MTPGLGYPRRLRLLRREQFQQIFEKQAFRSGDACFAVLAIPTGNGHPRLGIAVSRKTARRAVERNRIKRVVREEFRHWAERLGSFDLVVLGRQGVKGKGNGELRQSLHTHWQRLIRQCASS